MSNGGRRSDERGGDGHQHNRTRRPLEHGAQARGRSRDPGQRQCGNVRSTVSAVATPLPAGFRAHVANVGIKDDTDDFVVIVADRPCSAAGVFTKSRFAGPSVVLSRASVADGALRAYVVVSKNANVATGTQGMEDAREVIRGVAQAYDLGENDVLIASTGVIGRRYPMDRVRAHLTSLAPPLPLTEVEPAALGIMTTDTFAKVSSTMVGRRDDRRVRQGRRDDRARHGDVDRAVHDRRRRGRAGCSTRCSGESSIAR